jgi:CrcB protein
MRLLLLACVGGALGSGARYLTYVGVGRWVGIASPYAAAFATLLVNVVGSFLMGLVIELVALRYNGSLEVRTLLATGFLGGFTTFSAFSMDFAHLMQRGETAYAIAYVLASVIVSLLAIFAGLVAVRALLT